MKPLRLASSLVVAVLLTTGLVAGATEGPAQASNRCSPYAGQIKTTAKVSGTKKVPAGFKATLSARVRVSGNGAPAGDIRFTVKGPKVKGEKKYHFAHSVDYLAGTVSATTGKLSAKGAYKVTARFVPEECSVYKASSAHTSFKVK
jgi:hypothetical protein